MVNPPKEKMDSKASTATSEAKKIYDKLGEMTPSLAEQQIPKQVLDSARQIWLAGLGAFSRAQDEGKKIFDTLVQQGEKIEHHTRGFAEAGIETAREQASKALEVAGNKFDKLEQIFETRVHKSLRRLGVLTRKDVEGLVQQVAILSGNMQTLLAREKQAQKQMSPSGATRKIKKAPGTATKQSATVKKNNVN